MTDLNAANISLHRRNIQRYCRMLATQLTDWERQYLHRRISEEQAELDRLEQPVDVASCKPCLSAARPPVA